MAHKHNKIIKFCIFVNTHVFSLTLSPKDLLPEERKPAASVKNLRHVVDQDHLWKLATVTKAGKADAMIVYMELFRSFELFMQFRRIWVLTLKYAGQYF
jgi:hypothetical protein